MPPVGSAGPRAPRPAPARADGASAYARVEEPRLSGGFDGFQAGRHGRTDMTGEIRLPDRGFGGASPELSGEALRVDQLRRSFQVRRFGSGYDRGQVDELFDALVHAASGRTPVAVTEAELDPGQFHLVPGGYFEGEVDAALREVRDLLTRRR